MIKLALAFSAFALAAPAIAQPISPAELARIDALVAKTLADTGVPAASIAVVRGGKLVLAKAYGKASETIPVATPALPYQIASNSKQFTAAALLLLEDDGKLDLDDKVSKYLPGISGGDTIAIRQLLSHTSGLQDYWPQDYSFPAMATPITPQGIVDRWAKKPLDFAPGTQWQYSNTGYVVAGMIVEKVSGEPLFAFLKRRIFAPLGMASAMDQDLADGPAFPHGYERWALGPVHPVTVPARGWLYAAGELSMTAADFAKWDIARIDRTLLTADDWAEQERTVRLTDGKDTGYGLGVSARSVGGRRQVSHTGEAVGFLSTNTVYPDDKAAIVVLTNSWSGDAYTIISRGLARIVLPPTPQATETVARTARARRLYDSLRAGKLDPALVTPNLAYFFKPAVQADYRSSLAPLGEPTGFEATGEPVLRGGFVIQGYKVTYPAKTLSISAFAEPGATGRFEQFLVSPE